MAESVECLKDVCLEARKVSHSEVKHTLLGPGQFSFSEPSNPAWSFKSA